MQPHPHQIPERRSPSLPAPARPPPPANYQRDASVEWYSRPYREVTTTSKTIHQDYKYHGIGPVDESGTPLLPKQVVVCEKAKRKFLFFQQIEPDSQADWYKAMFKKMHQLDEKG